MQDRCGGQVVVPHAVVQNLEVPFALAGLCVQRHDALAEETVARLVAAPEVVGCALDGEIDHAQLGIGRHHRPDGCCAKVLPAVILPRVVAEFAGARNRVEGPQALAGADVEAAHIARRAALPLDRVVADHLDDNNVAHDDARRGGVHVLQRTIIAWRQELLHQVDLAVDAEVRIGLAGHRVDGQQAAIDRVVQDALRCPVSPPRQGAAGAGEAARRLLAIGIGFVRPQRGAGRRVDRRDAGAAVGHVHHAIDHQRRRLPVGVRAAGDVGRLPPPCDFQLANILRVDLREWGIARVARIAAPGDPFTRLARSNLLGKWDGRRLGRGPILRGHHLGASKRQRCDGSQHAQLVGCMKSHRVPPGRCLDAASLQSLWTAKLTGQRRK